MPLNKDFEELFHHLNNVQAKFMVVGAYAVIHYTQPRYTKDIDIWIKPDPKNAEKVHKALKKFGAPLGELTLEDLTNPELVYQIGIEPNRIDILMGIGPLNFDNAWKSRVKTSYGKEKISILQIQDLIKSKKVANRPKDKLDLQLLSKVQKLKQFKKLPKKIKFTLTKKKLGKIRRD